MNVWFEVIGVICVIVLGGVVGKFAGQLRRPYWLIGYFLPLMVLAIVIAAKFSPSLNFLPPFSWFLAGRIKFVVLALVATVSLITLLPHVSRKYQKILIYSLVTVFVSSLSILPFLGPVLIKNGLSNLTTTVDGSGVCLQSSSYTCGPAAAVTALRQLGLPADEGEIAILSRTIPIVGTLPKCLQSAIQSRYESEGLRSEYRRFSSVGQLKGVGVTLAVMRSTLFSDHCVVVLNVTDNTVEIADPVSGRLSLSYEQFAKDWRFSGIVLRRRIAKAG